MKSYSRLALLVIIIALVAGFWFFDLGHYLSLDYLKSQQAHLASLRASEPTLTITVFFLVYVLVTALSIPGAAILTLAAGAIFGVLWGTIIVSFASTIGATGAFLAARYLLRDRIQQQYGDRLKTINAGIEKDGAFYLFTLRLVPVFPFFLINLLLGLSAMSMRTFFWVSQIGMFAGTLVYVNAGTQIAKITSLQGILSPKLLGAFVLLGFFPWLANRIIALVRARQVYAPFQKPARFDRNMVVIGAGAGGLVTSYIAAAVKAKVSLVEKHKMGGDCLNYGCVPSKALIRSAKYASQLKRGSEFGFEGVTGEANFAKVMERVAKIVDEIEPHDSVSRYRDLGVDVIEGNAVIIDPWTVEITRADGVKQRLSTKSIVVAAGAEPFVPPIPGLQDTGFVTSDTLWNLRELPKRLVVLGGGPIGCELAQAFARLGAEVTQVEMLPSIMMREDPEVAERVIQRMRAEGVDLRLNTKAKATRLVDGEKRLVVEHDGIESELVFDEILVAVGRSARLKGYGLEALGVKTGRTLEVNEFLQTNFPNIYACGDVAGPYQFTHTAAHMAWYAAVNALFSPLLWLRGGQFKVDYSVIPWATFTAPEVARVGLNETDAKAQGVAYDVVSYGIDDLDRAIADGEAHGLVKVLTVPGKDKILGVTIVGEHAGDLIAEFVLAMRHGLGLNKVLGTIHIYPTFSEANKYAAGLWKQAHKPEKLLGYVERFHAWRRG